MGSHCDSDNGNVLSLINQKMRTGATGKTNQAMKVLKTLAINSQNIIKIDWINCIDYFRIIFQDLFRTQLKFL